MPDKEAKNKAHRMVVEEVNTSGASEVAPEPQATEVPAETQPTEAAVVSEVAPVVEEKNKEVQVEQTQSAPVVSQENPSAPVEQTPKKPKSPVFWILIPGIFILGAILGGIVFYQRGVSTKTETTPTPSASTQSSSTPSPSASPSANVDVSKYEVAVLNGSGIAGEANKVKALLEDAGFTVSSTGNAATYDYTDTIIKAKSTVDEAIIKKLSDSLSGTYLVGDSQTLSASSATDIQVIVGSSKAE